MPRLPHRQYYLVRWGPRRTDNSNVRVSSGPMLSGAAACQDTFGQVRENMFVKGVGPNKKAILNNTKRIDLINSEEGWESMEGVVEAI